jgi:hypothetical protein
MPTTFSIMTSAVRTTGRRLRAVLSVATLAGALSGCDSILEVSNPGALQEGQLSDPALEQFIVNGAIGEFQYAYGFYALYSSVLADETFTDHTNVSIRELSLHNFNDLNDQTTDVFSNLSRARASADDGVTRLTAILGAANAAKSLNVARLLAYGGYSYVLLGEGYCDAPVNLSAGLPPAELFRRAIAHFDSAITVATAASAGAPAATVTAATDIINMSRVGAARAALKMNDLARAKT